MSHNCYCEYVGLVLLCPATDEDSCALLHCANICLTDRRPAHFPKAPVESPSGMLCVDDCSIGCQQAAGVACLSVPREE